MGGERLVVIGAASSAGAYGPGQERAPEVLRRHGLTESLAAAGLEATDRGDVVHEVFREEPGHPAAQNVPVVADVCRSVADEVASALGDGARVLVLGGDCTVELGTVAGAVRDGARVGLVYIDLDTDLNTPATGDGILDWMGVAHLLGVPGAEPDLAGIGGRRPLLAPGQVHYLAADRSTLAERRVIDRLGLPNISVVEVVADPGAAVARIGDWAYGLDRLLVHVDADVLDFADFPIAENDRVVPGLPFVVLEEVLAGLCALPSWSALTVCEVNPDRAVDEDGQFARLVAALTRAACRRG